MEVGTAAGGGGPAPFLMKTYDMVDDSSTDEIVSWSSSKNSFVVWNPPEFARILLPTYFKHNNFSSFIRQLNTYGFRKIDPDKWEFANEEYFIKDQKHLLKNIHRRKPIHSHSLPHGSVVDPERAAFDEEIERLSHEKSTLESDLLRSKQQFATDKLHFEDLTQRVNSMEQRQEKLLSFLQKAVKNPNFIEHLTQKFESMDVTAYSKKRRLPRQQISENSFLDNFSSSRPDFGNIIHQEFSNNLSLELSPAVSDINLVSRSTQSSNDDGGTQQVNLPECPIFATETFELSDTGTSSKFRMGSSLLQKMADNEGTGLLSSQQSLETNIEDNECHISCQLNLTLASSPLQVNKSKPSSQLKSNDNGKEKNLIPEKINHADEERHVATKVRVNDVFWEQFLTERPGASDTEEASSSIGIKSYHEKEDKRLCHEMSRTEKSMDHLTL